MPKRLAQFALMLLFALVAAGTVNAQVQTGELSGLVKTSDGLSLPGATVTITSPALQGSRTIVSDENGAYVLRALPPGAYTVTAEMSGMNARTEKVGVELGRQARLDLTLGLANVSETVTVSATTESAALNSTQVGANYTSKEINMLPTGRTPSLIAELSPGLTANTPNAGQVTMAGAFAYDNVFLVNGVDINDNLFNNQKQIAWNTTVRPDPNSPLDEFGLPTGYIKGTTFGQPNSNTNFAVWRANQTGGRTFLAAMGIRF